LWSVDHITHLFHTTHKAKTQQVTRSRGQQCGDIELTDDYLENGTGPVPLVMDLRIVHDRFGSSSDPNLNRHLHYPDEIERSLNEAAADKIRKYRTDYNNNPPNTISFMSGITSTSDRLHSEFVRLLFLQSHRETDRSGVQLTEHTLQVCVPSASSATLRQIHGMGTRGMPWITTQ